MIVLDASATLDWLLQTTAGGKIERRIFARGEGLHAPHLLDLEVAQALRRFARDGAISADRAQAALDDLLALRVTRYSHRLLLPRIWQLRHDLTAYDAAYVALAELLGAPLITRDRRLASAAGHAAEVEVM